MKRGRRFCAGILTLPEAKRRVFGVAPPMATRACLALLQAGSCAVAAMSPQLAAAGEHHPVQEITQAAEDYLERRIAGTGRRVTPHAGKLDPRLRLVRCDQPLAGFLRTGTEIGNRTVVGVRCSGSSPWKVYVPVDLVEMRPVLVARQALPRGHRLTAGDLVAEERDVSRLPGGFVADADVVLGRELKRQLVSGAVLSPSMLETEIVVRRGQSVTLVVRDDALNIRMAGKALADGAVDQRIRVENTVSRRVVEGFVRSAEYVEVLVR